MLASILGLFLLTPYPKQWGFYRWQAEQEPLLFAFTPAHYYGIDWKFTFADLEEVDLSDQHALVTGLTVFDSILLIATRRPSPSSSGIL